MDLSSIPESAVTPGSQIALGGNISLSACLSPCVHLYLHNSLGMPQYQVFKRFMQSLRHCQHGLPVDSVGGEAFLTDLDVLGTRLAWEGSNSKTKRRLHKQVLESGSRALF